MDPSGSTVWMEAVALVAVFALIGAALWRLTPRRTAVTRKRDRNGDGATTFSDNDGNGDGGDGGGD
jgi:hypothetical protein